MTQVAARHREGFRRFLADIAKPDRPVVGDVVAGVSVAMVLIPQSMAYADLAGLPPFVGLFAAAFPLLMFALFASSPYLQTGPVALTSLLTFGALAVTGSEPGSVSYVQQAALLAVIVGAVRLLLGVLRLGLVAYLMAEPVMIGFTSAAGLVILSSQLPKALGVAEVVPDSENPIVEALWALGHPGQWRGVAVGLAVVTLILMLGGRSIHRLFPGVLVAVILGVVFSNASDYDGAVVGGIPEGLPSFTLDLPWSDLPSLILGGVVIALVGFAEPASIARTFAGEDGEPWSASQEFFSSGWANLAAGVTGAFPVGGSFSRSSVNRFAGARSKWSGGITGLVVLAFLPFAGVLEALPTAVLGAIVVGAVTSLVKPKRLLSLWRRSKSQALLTYVTFFATLITPPEVFWAVILGVLLTVVHHFAFKLKLTVDASDPAMLRIRPDGLLWIGSNGVLAERLKAAIANHGSSPAIEVDLGGVPSVDSGIADALGIAVEAAGGRSVIVINPPEGAKALLQGAGCQLRESEISQHELSES
ncbi:MAG: SulP family inorganic anion transporter [Acidimicrobiales bacterium]